MGAAFLLTTAVVYPAFAEDGDEPGAEPESAAAAPAQAGSDGAAPDSASGKRTRKQRGKSRRGHGPKFAGRVVAESDLRDEPLPRPSGNLEIVSLANVDKGQPTLLTHGDHDGRRTISYDDTDTVTKNFESWADAVEGRGKYRFSDEELIENIRIFEAIVTSSKNDGAAQKL